MRAAVEAEVIGARQGVVIAQGLKDDPRLIPPAIAAAQGRSVAETRAIVRQTQKQKEDPAIEPGERVRRAVAKASAQGVPDVGSLPIHVRESAPIRHGGEVVGSIDTDYVVLANTALGAVPPRRQTMTRTEVAEMLQLFCEQTNIWPGRLLEPDGVTVPEAGA